MTKLRIVFDDEAREMLKHLRERNGAASDAEVLKRALGTYDWLLDRIAEGYAVGAFKAGEEVREISLTEWPL